MKISKIIIYKSPVKLKEPFITSLGQLNYAENIIVEINTDSGLTGYGECSPFKSINGESIDTCFIVGQYFANAMLGKSPVDIENCTQVMNSVIFGNTSIKSAFDIALYDIASQHAGQPLFRFLKGDNRKKLFTDYTVSVGDPEKMARDAQKIKDNGFPVIKVKLGTSGAEDVARIQSIRNAVGYDIQIRIDANQGWNTDEAVRTLNALSKFNIQFCEEPIPRWNFMDLPVVSRQSSIPIMADESCCDHHDAQRLVDLKACTLFNVKLGKSAGIFTALKIISIAEQHHIKMQVGGFLESRLGFTASAHLALASENIIYCDFDTPLMFVDDPVIAGIKYSDNGEITIPETPGLGAVPDPNYLMRLEMQVII